jgi:hypothetical protein
MNPLKGEPARIFGPMIRPHAVYDSVSFVKSFQTREIVYYLAVLREIFIDAST